MSGRATRWIAAIPISIGVNVAAVVGLIASLAPAAAPEQGVPKSQFELQTFDVAARRAEPEEPGTQRANEGAAKSPELSQAPIPRRQAVDQAPNPSKTEALSVTGQTTESASLDQKAAGELPGDVAALVDSALAPVAAALATPGQMDARPGALDSLSDSARETAALGTVLTETEAQDVPALQVIVEDEVQTRPEPVPSAVAPPAISQSVSIAALDTPTHKAAGEVLAPGIADPAKAPAIQVANVAISNVVVAEASETPRLIQAALPIGTPSASSRVQPKLSTAILPPTRPSSESNAPVAPAEPGETDGNEAIEGAPATIVATEDQPNAPLANAADAPAIGITAALAFSTGDQSNIDPVSLAAIQSFLQPDLSSGQSGKSARDGIAGLLGGVACARLQATFLPETGQLSLTGHIPEAGLRGPILASLEGFMGQSVGVQDNMLVLPAPQCGMLSQVEALGLPQSTDQFTNPLVVGPDTHARAYDYRTDDRLILDVTAPDYPAFFYVDYFDAKGQVVHLAPNDTVPLRRIFPGEVFKIGSANDGSPSLEIRIGPPYGQEIAVAFASSVELYPGLRPIVEPAEPYLEWLRDRIVSARADTPDFKGEWVYFFVSTSARQ